MAFVIAATRLLIQVYSRRGDTVSYADLAKTAKIIDFSVASNFATGSLKMNFNRSNPFFSRIIERSLLTKRGSSKKTYFLSLTLAGSGIAYKPGDSLAVLPANDEKEVDALLLRVGATGSEEIKDPRSERHLSIREFLLEKADLRKASPALLKAAAERNLLLQDTACFPLDLLKPGLFSPEELAGLLLPLLPRFYSISSSQRVHPDEAHLTVVLATFFINGQRQYGVASRFLTQARINDTPIPLYLHSSKFSLPANPAMPIILVGSGCGIAPFRAFLEERLATNAPGRNWLFFGERNCKTDFYYEDFWLSLQKQNFLRLDTAFSRDGTEKNYVQHRLWAERKDIWASLCDGAYFYVCGQAKHMAKDVEHTLVRIAKSEGNLSEEAAAHYVKSLRASRRYLTDIY